MLNQTEKTALLASLSALGQGLIQQAHDAQGQLLSKTQHAVSISDPQVRQSVQSKLDHSVNLIAIANVMAIFEHHFPRRYWVKVYKDPTLTKQLRAFRHMQHCAISASQVPAPQTAEAISIAFSRRPPNPTGLRDCRTKN